jgi:ATP-dependent Clp protease ATP-binding subunit ClpE
MLCEKCNEQQATISLTLKLNEHNQQSMLCESCYREERQKIGSTLGGPFHHSQGFGPFPMEEFFKQMNQKQQSPHHQPKSTKGVDGFIGQYGRNLTQMARAGLIDPVIGRDDEISRVIEILNRRGKNNPVLIGEPGVGKTAIAEGLALKIVEEEVPNKLKGKEVYLLDVASLVANTGIRGQFEERMKVLLNELQQRKNILLFVDEIHLLVGAGSAEGSMDAGNILKPALGRGELQLVGATTLKEYRAIEKDAALERRFQPVQVKEPTIDQAFEILKGLRQRYEDFHQVSFSDEVLKACVSLSNRYIQDRFLPDKAIDLMDEAGSKVNLSLATPSTEEIGERLNELSKQKEAALKIEKYEEAAKIREEELKLEKVLQTGCKTNRPSVQVELIQDIVEKKTGIPVGKLQTDEQHKLQNLEKNLAAKVIGQEQAVQKVAKAIRRSRAGLKSKHRPIGSFLFVGPTGVGKTELTKSLSKELFGSEDAMIRLDMSEYMEKHAISKLIGSPPGYIGHEEAGQLTEKVRRNPYSIILLDEIEKAHPDVQHMFLQILEDGRLTDSQGRTVSFKDTVIIMTSNAGIGHRTLQVGFEKNNALEESSILKALGNFFKPEFLNRFDNIIEFKSLEKPHLIQIIDLLLKELNNSLYDNGITLTYTDDVKEKLAELGYHPSFGARPLRRAIQEHLEDPVTDVIIDDPNARNLQATLHNDQIIIKKA